MIGTEQEALAFAVTQCATDGREWRISDSNDNTIWTIERDTKVDDDDLSWPVIVHLHGSLASEAIAILTEAGAAREP
jgi:hypothetical protein